MTRLAERKLECALETLARVTELYDLSGQERDAIATARTILWNILDVEQRV